MGRRNRSGGRVRADLGLDADSFFGGEGEGQARKRKEGQLCRQVHEAVSEALACADSAVLWDVVVLDVRPAPDAGRLAVLVQAPEGVDADAVREHLARVESYIRREVAAAITRKRTPTFAPSATLCASCGGSNRCSCTKRRNRRHPRSSCLCGFAARSNATTPIRSASPSDARHPHRLGRTTIVAPLAAIRSSSASPTGRQSVAVFGWSVIGAAARR